MNIEEYRTKNKELFNDFSKICRLCLNFGQLISLKESISILKSINVKIELNESLPDNICSQCMKFLQDIANFIKNLKINDAYLHEILSKQAVKCDYEEQIRVDDNAYEDNLNEDESNHPTPKLRNVEDLVLKHKKTEVEIHSKSDNKQHTCNICGHQFMRLIGLKRHMKIHLGIRPFKCDKCDKIFQEKLALKRHTLIHTGEQPYECNLCERFTRRKDQVIEHIQKQHPSTPEYTSFITKHESSIVSNNKDTQQWESKISNDRNSNSKDRIFKTRTRIEICLCNLCGKVFRRYWSLRNHMAIHDKIKPICPKCGKELHSASHFKTHVLTHTGEKPHECNICGKKFTVQRTLKSHMNIHKGLNLIDVANVTSVLELQIH